MVLRAEDWREVWLVRSLSGGKGEGVILLPTSLQSMDAINKLFKSVQSPRLALRRDLIVFQRMGACLSKKKSKKQKKTIYGLKTVTRQGNPSLGLVVPFNT